MTRAELSARLARQSHVENDAYLIAKPANRLASRLGAADTAGFLADDLPEYTRYEGMVVLPLSSCMSMDDGEVRRRRTVLRWYEYELIFWPAAM